jgi:formate hydrogenlyase subunit 6/NADH:ubiquinone oxidoreductase subunit I
MEETDVLRILRVINGNLVEGPATVRLPASVPSPAGYRGPVVLDPARCLACRICAYVCVTAAITGAEEGAAYAWTYDPGRCTFCARCLERCPGAALTMLAEPSPAYTRVGELEVLYMIPFPACPDCGAPVRRVTDELLGRAFEQVTEETRELMRRCERCRRRRLQQSLLAAGSAPGKEKTP